jgi:DNA recombination protein RmuC
MDQNIIILAAVTLTGIAVVGWFIIQKLNQLMGKDLNDQRAKDIVNQVFGEVSQKVIEQAKTVLQGDKEAIYKDTENKKAAIEKIVTDLKQEIDTRQEEIRKLEIDRNKKFGQISESIDQHRKITDELKTSTQNLAKVLSNNQVRGQWGERIIEDILQNAGLLETIHYEKQKVLGPSAVKPDITLLLPNGRKVAIDVKFPYSQVQQMADADSQSAKEAHRKAFEHDLKDKINQIDKRGYINEQEGTLDYAIMFVPNEMLFSFINQQFPAIIDEAMAKKIMIVSPFTFLIVARTVMESYRNFMIENNLRQIVKHISEFVNQWQRFADEFGKFDIKISQLRESFDQIHNTRYRTMARSIDRIEEYRQGSLKESSASPAQLTEPSDHD